MLEDRKPWLPSFSRRGNGEEWPIRVKLLGAGVFVVACAAGDYLYYKPVWPETMVTPSRLPVSAMLFFSGYLFVAVLSTLSKERLLLMRDLFRPGSGVPWREALPQLRKEMVSDFLEGQEYVPYKMRKAARNRISARLARQPKQGAQSVESAAGSSASD